MSTLEGMRAVGKAIPKKVRDLEMAELWQMVKPLVPTGDRLWVEPIKFRSARKTSTLTSLFAGRYGQHVNERRLRACIKWAQEQGELLICSANGVKYARSKDEFDAWARTQLRHAFAILRFWRKVAPRLAEEIQGQLDAVSGSAATADEADQPPATATGT